jgi:hypothetical protein
MNITVYESTNSKRFLKIRYIPDHKHVEHGLFSITDENDHIREFNEKALFDILTNGMELDAG